MISHSYHVASAQIRCSPLPEIGVARSRATEPARIDFLERGKLLDLGLGRGMPASPIVASAPSSSDVDCTPTVFIVDNDISARESLADLIRTSGWRAEAFGSAFGFLERPHMPVPSCVVLDLRLPDLSGLELQRRIAAERSEMPVIFLTGYSDVPVAVQAMKAGAIEFFMKPFDDEELLTAIGRALEASRTRLEHEAELRALRRRHEALERPRAGGDGAGRHGAAQQTGRLRAGHQRNHREGPSRQGHAQDGGEFPGRPDHDGDEA